MDNDLKRAVAEFKPVARTFQAVLAIAAELEKLGDLDNQRQDLEGKCRDLQASLDAAQKGLEATRAETARLVVEGERAKAQAVDAANEQRHNAKAHYDGQCAKAKRDAEEIVARSKKEASTVKRVAEEEAQRVRDEAERRGEAVRTEVATAEHRLRELDGQISAKAAQLAAIEERLAKARQAAAAMLGAAG